MTQDVHLAFLRRIERGELDGGEDLATRFRQFAQELNLTASQGLLTVAEVTSLWMEHLKRMNHGIDAPDR